MFNTQDIYLAAACLSLGADLEDVDTRDKRHMRFSLSSDSLDFDLITDAYYRRELSVNASDFRDALKRLKAFIHSV